MIALKVYNEFLHLSEGERITIDFNNNFFSSGIIRDSFSYSFKIPNDPHNRRLLGSVGLLESTSTYQDSTTVEIYILHQYWRSAVLSISEGAYEDNNIQIKIDLDYGEFNERVGTRTLRELVQGMSLDLGPREETNFWRFEVPNRHQNGQNYGDGTLEGGGGVGDPEIRLTVFTLSPRDLEEANEEYFAYSITFDGSLDSTLSEFARIINQASPKRFVAESVEDYLILSSNRYPDHPLELVIQTRETRDIYDIYTSIPRFQIQSEYEYFVFPTVAAQSFYDGKNEDYGGIINDYNEVLEEYFWNDPNNVLERNKYNLVPMFFLKFILEVIEEASGYQIIGDFVEDQELQNLIFFNTYSLDQNGKEDYGFDLNIYNEKVNYAEHIPPVTVNELLECLQMFCIYPKFDFQRKTLTLNFRKNVFRNDSYEDISDRTSISKEIVEKRKNIVLKYADEFKLPPVKIGEFGTSEEIPFGAGTLAQNEEEEYPNYRGTGNSPMFDLGLENEYLPTLLFWRGLKDGKPRAEVIARHGRYSLHWETPKGLYETFWKEYLNFRLLSKKVEARIIINLNSMVRLSRDMSEKRKYGNLLYIIESVRVQVENSEQPFKRAAKATIYKIPLTASPS